jgi:uncharacterized protein (UPF0332 family)
VIELWDKALEAAKEARALQAANLPNGAVSRADYAAFTAARALLVSKAGIDVMKIRRHAAVHKLSSEHLVRPGLLSPELGRDLRALFEDRADADYSTTSVSREDAEHAIAVMERFLTEAATLLGQPRS